MSPLPHAPPNRTLSPYAIAFCITGLEPGGAEKNLVELATRLDPTRFRATVYSLGPRPQRRVLVERLQEAGVDTYFLDCTQQRQYFLAVKRLTDGLRQLRPALLQTFLFHANLIGAAAARRVGELPFVTGMRVAEPHRPLRSMLEKYGTSRAGRSICVSDEVARQTQRVDREKIVVIPNGVDVSKFALSGDSLREFPAPASGRKWLTYVGRLDRQKRVDRLVAAFASLPETLPRHDLLIVGDGPLRAKVQRQIAACGLTDRVRFTGWREDIPAILQATDILLLASDWEGMPNVILEAMAAAVPVVSFDVPGVLQLLGERVREQVVFRADCRSEAERIAQFAQRIVALAKTPQLRNRIGEENRQRVRTHFALTQTVAAYEAVYSELLRDAPAAL